MAGSTGNGRDFSNERPAISIYPPAVLRHVVFRMAAAENPRFQDDPVVRAACWARLCACLTDHVNAIRAAYGEAPDVAIVVPPEESDEDNLRYSVQRTVIVPIFKAMDYGYLLRLRIDVHTELFAITYLVDGIGDANRGSGRSDGTLQEKIAKLRTDPSGLEWLFEDFWKSSEFPAAALIAPWTEPRDGSVGFSRQVGEPVADFRSVLITPEVGWKMENPDLSRAAIEQPAAPRIAPEIVAFASAHERLIHAVACREDGETAVRGGTESVVCGVGGGQALYAAELGQWPRKTGKATPIRHLLVYAGHSHAQLGRLVRRMHVLGELRHAAVLDWDLGAGRNDLRHASLRLRELGKKVDEATLKPSFEALRPILTDLAEIGKVGETGLNYRVEQSRYYAEEYLSQLEHLRVVRLGDWQPYDDFVRRQITQLFNRIHRIGNRYEALGRRVDRLIHYEQAKGVSTYQGTVGKLLISIERATKTLNEANGDTVELLVNAEVIASLFAVYYVGSILKDGVADTKGWLAHLTGCSVIPWVYSLAWLLVAIALPLGVRLASRKRRRRRQLQIAERAREEQLAEDEARPA